MPWNCAGAWTVHEAHEAQVNEVERAIHLVIAMAEDQQGITTGCTERARSCFDSCDGLRQNMCDRFVLATATMYMLGKRSQAEELYRRVWDAYERT